MVKIGWGLMIGIPIGMVAIGMMLPRSADIRLVLLLLMVVGILATGGYMIAVEFINYGLKNQLAIGDGDGKKESRVRTRIEKEIREIREKSEKEKEKRGSGKKSENQKRIEKRNEKKKGGRK